MSEPMPQKESLTTSVEVSSEANKTEKELAERLTKIEGQLAQLSEMLKLVTDIYRYQNLRDLLVAQKFKEADLETTKILLEVAGQTTQDDLTPALLKTLPTNVLRVIDQLWKEHSQGRFGFSVQLQIYQDKGGSKNLAVAGDMKILSQTVVEFGWLDNINSLQLRNYEELDFSLKAPKGCFPMQWWASPYGAKLANFFLSRLIDCEF